MKWKLRCAIEQEGDWFVSYCDELNIASQGRSIDEARNNLEEAIQMFFEDASSTEILGALSKIEPETTVEIQRKLDITPYMGTQDTQWELSVA